MGGGSPIDPNRRGRSPTDVTIEASVQTSAPLPLAEANAHAVSAGHVTVFDAVEMPPRGSAVFGVRRGRSTGAAPTAPGGASTRAAMQHVRARGDVDEWKREVKSAGVDPRTTALVAKLCLAEFSSDAAQGECIQRIQAALDVALDVQRADGRRRVAGGHGQPTTTPNPSADPGARGGSTVGGEVTTPHSGTMNRGSTVVDGAAPTEGEVSASHERHILEATNDPMLARLARVVIRGAALPGPMRPAGSIGVMGISVEVARAVYPSAVRYSDAGVEQLLREPRENIRVGIEVLKRYLERFGNPQLAVDAFFLDAERGVTMDPPGHASEQSSAAPDGESEESTLRNNVIGRPDQGLPQRPEHHGPSVIGRNPVAGRTGAGR